MDYSDLFDIFSGTGEILGGKSKPSSSPQSNWIFVTLYVDRRTPFSPQNNLSATSGVSGGPTPVQWALSPSLPLAHPTQLATFMRLLGHDDRLASQVDMELFMFAKRVRLAPAAMQQRLNATPGAPYYDSVSLDSNRRVSELGIVAGDELDLMLDENAVNAKRDRLDNSQHRLGTSGADLSASRTSLTSLHRGGVANNPPSPFRNLGGMPLSHMEDSITSQQRGGQQLLAGGNRSPKEASVSRYSPHTPSFAFQRNGEDGYETAVDAAGWPLMGAGGGATVSQILRRANEETQEAAQERRGELPPRAAVVRPITGVPGGPLDPRLQQLLDNAYARQNATAAAAAGASEQAGSYSDEMDASRSFPSQSAAVNSPSGAGGSHSRLRDIMARSQQQQPQAPALDPRLQQLLDNAKTLYPQAAPLAAPRPLPVSEASGALDPRLQQLLDNAKTMYPQAAPQASQNNSRHVSYDTLENDNVDDATSDDYSYNDMSAEYAKIEDSFREEGNHPRPANHRSNGGGSRLQDLMNTARAQTEVSSRQAPRRPAPNPQHRSQNTAQRKGAGGVPQQQLDPQLQQLLENAKQFQQLSHTEAYDEEDEEELSNGSPNRLTSTGQRSGGGGLRALMKRANRESHQRRQGSRENAHWAEDNDDDEPTMGAPRQEYDFNAQDPWEVDPWLENDENKRRRQQQRGGGAQQQAATTPLRRGGSARDLGADEILAMVAEAQQQAIEAAGLNDEDYDDAGFEFAGDQYEEVEEYTEVPEDDEDNEDVPEVVRLMRTARRNRRQILKDCYSHTAAGVQNGAGEEVDDDGNPIVLLPNVDDYLMELDNEEMELELHEISEQLRAVTSTAGGASDQSEDGAGSAHDDVGELLHQEHLQKTLDRLVAIACRRSRLKRHRKKSLRAERRYVASQAKARRSAVVPHHQRHVDPAGTTFATIANDEGRRDSESLTRGTMPPHDAKRKTTTYGDRHQSSPPLILAHSPISVLIRDETHRFQKTSLGERLQRAYLPSVMDLM